MTALNFPDSPLVGDTFSAGGRTWQWTGTTWDILTSGAVVVPLLPHGFLLMGA